MKTKDRIIATSLQLFNERGERHVSTNHIAAALQISPGNLYYHFRNKEDIVAALFERMASGIEQALRGCDKPSLSLPELFGMLDALFECLWQYRFFSSNLTNILGRDAALARRYAAFTEQCQGRWRALLHTLAQQGTLTLKASDYPALTENCWLISMFWFSYRESVSSGTALCERSVLAGVVQLLALLKPYVTGGALVLFTQLSEFYLHRPEPAKTTLQAV